MSRSTNVRQARRERERQRDLCGMVAINSGMGERQYAPER